MGIDIGILLLKILFFERAACRQGSYQISSLPTKSGSKSSVSLQILGDKIWIFPSPGRLAQDFVDAQVSAQDYRFRGNDKLRLSKNIRQYSIYQYNKVK